LRVKLNPRNTWQASGKVSEIVGRDNCAAHRKDIYERLEEVERVTHGYEEIKSSMAKTEDIKAAISESTKGLASKDDLSKLAIILIHV